jgi:hypothetical protein
MTSASIYSEFIMALSLLLPSQPFAAQSFSGAFFADISLT